MDLTKMMAPFTPFAAEHVFQSLRTYQSDIPESVHLTEYPKPKKSKINKELEAGVTWMNRLLILARQARNDAKIKVKTPLQSMKVIHNDATVLQQIKPLFEILKSELNIKEIIMTQDEDDYVKVHALPNSPVLGKRFGKDFGKIRQQICALEPSQIRSLEHNGAITIGEHSFQTTDILIRRQTNEQHNAVTDGYVSIALDTQLNDHLINEGLAREVVNRIQKTRKDIALNVSDRISIIVNVEATLQHVIEQHADYIKQETLTENISFSPDILDNAHDIDDMKLYIEIKTN